MCRAGHGAALPGRLQYAERKLQTLVPVTYSAELRSVLISGSLLEKNRAQFLCSLCTHVWALPVIVYEHLILTYVLLYTGVLISP